MSIHQTKDGRWFCVWYEEKKQRRKVFGRGEAAHVLATQFETTQKLSKRTVTAGLTVSHVCVEYHTLHSVSASTSDSDGYRLQNSILPLLGDRDAEQISTKDLDQYVIKRVEKGVVHTTIARELRLLKAAFAWARAQSPPIISRDPVAGYKVKSQTGGESIAPPTPSEVQRLVRASVPHLVRAILTAWYCGTRPGKELFGITWTDVDFDRMEIRVLAARKGSAVVRYVPIHCEFFEALKGWFEQDQKDYKGEIMNVPVVHYRGKPVGSIKTAWRESKARAGITRKLRPYDLRHAFATYALRAGADIHAVSQVMGHSRPDTTMRHYQHVSRSQHVSAVAAIPAIKLDNTDNVVLVKGSIKPKR